MLPIEYHLTWQRRAVVAGIILVIDAIYSMKKLPTSNKYIKAFRWLRLGIGLTTIYIDGFVFLPAMGGSFFG